MWTHVSAYFCFKDTFYRWNLKGSSAFYGLLHTCSLVHCCLKTEHKTCLTILMRHSQNPWRWEAVRELKLHWTSSFIRPLWNFLWSNVLSASLNSFSLPTGLVPWLDLMCCAWPLRHKNLLILLKGLRMVVSPWQTFHLAGQPSFANQVGFHSLCKLHSERQSFSLQS